MGGVKKRDTRPASSEKMIDLIGKHAAKVGGLGLLDLMNLIEAFHTTALSHADDCACEICEAVRDNRGPL